MGVWWERVMENENEQNTLNTHTTLSKNIKSVRTAIQGRAGTGNSKMEASPVQCSWDFSAQTQDIGRCLPPAGWHVPLRSLVSLAPAVFSLSLVWDENLNVFWDILKTCKDDSGVAVWASLIHPPIRLTALLGERYSNNCICQRSSERESQITGTTNDQTAEMGWKGFGFSPWLELLYSDQLALSEYGVGTHLQEEDSRAGGSFPQRPAALHMCLRDLIPKHIGQQKSCKRVASSYTDPGSETFMSLCSLGLKCLQRGLAKLC